MTYNVTFPHLGLEFNINPVAFSIGNFHVYWYGIIIAAGFLLALIYASFSYKKMNIDINRLFDVVIVGLIAGVIFARLFYVVFYPGDKYWKNPLEIFQIHDGGLAIYGGVIAVVIVAVILCRSRHIKLGAMMDLVVMGLLIGQAIGRWGNFMNREAHGAVTEAFLKMGLQDAAGVVTYYHPTFLYESVWNLIGFIGLHLFSKKRKFDGEVFLLYVAWYGLGRAWIEGLRTDSLYLFSTGIRVSQLVAIVSFLAAAGILAWVLLKKKPAPDALYVNRKPAEPEAADGKDTDD